MNKAELQQMDNDRVRDAKVLLGAGRWTAAYYLAGYAVECGLKACIVGYLMRTDQFPEKKFSEQCWTHNLMQLLSLSGLKKEFDAATVADADLSGSWGFVKDWNESSRYTRKTKTQAQQLYDAITDTKHGVLSWIKSRW